MTVAGPCTGTEGDSQIAIDRDLQTINTPTYGQHRFRLLSAQPFPCVSKSLLGQALKILPDLFDKIGGASHPDEMIEMGECGAAINLGTASIWMRASPGA